MTASSDEEAIARWNERAELVALADAIRRPMGVIPDSAMGYLNDELLNAAEKRREKIDPSTISGQLMRSRRPNRGLSNPHGHYQYW